MTLPSHRQMRSSRSLLSADHLMLLREGVAGEIEDRRIMALCRKLAACGIVVMTVLPVRAQNLISSCEVRAYERFIRITVAMTEPPVSTTSAQPGLDEAMEGEVRFSFANARLAAGSAAPLCPGMGIRLLPVVSSGEVLLGLTPAFAFTFNAFYFAPRRVFIIDLLRRPHAAVNARSESPVENAGDALARGDTATALAALQRIVAYDPAQAAANYHLGLIRLARGDAEMARQNFLRAGGSDSAYAGRVREQLQLIAAESRKAAPIHVRQLRAWLRNNASTVWLVSLVCAVLGVALLVGHVRSRKARRGVQHNQEQPAFSSLVAKSLTKQTVRLAQLEQAPGLEEGPPIADAPTKRPARPFRLPAPIFASSTKWSSIAVDLPHPSSAGVQPASVARGLGIGQGEVELQLYMQRHRLEEESNSIKMPRLTFAEG